VSVVSRSQNTELPGGRPAYRRTVGFGLPGSELLNSDSCILDSASHLLSTTKTGNIRYARKDAKTTNSGSMGTQTRRRRGAEIARRFEAGHKRSS